MPIENVEDLRAHVALATKVELSTVPPYLYAMYSIRDQQSEAARLIASIVVEEMLHVCLTTNLLLALGGEPDFGKDVTPSFPGLLAHHRPALPLELKAFSIDLVQSMFMNLERPQPDDAEPEDEDFETLGQFYAALTLALGTLDGRTDLFRDHRPMRQLTNPGFYGPVSFDAEDSGGLMLIDDLTSARRALEVVIHQGEGVGHERWADPGHLELTHFHKLTELASGSVAVGPVWPVLDNPRTAELPAGVQDVSHLFNAFYRLTFITLTDLFSGRTDQGPGIETLYLLMKGCLAATACYLVSLPAGDDRTAGPTFEYYEFGDDPWQETARLASTVARVHPALADVAARTIARAGWAIP
jgi:hypothetical protein